MLLNLVLLFMLPAAAGLATLFPGRGDRGKYAAAAVFALGLLYSVFSFVAKPGPVSAVLAEGFSLSLGYNVIAAFIMIFINLFGLLTCLYSHGYAGDRRGFVSYLLLLVGFANLTVMAADFTVFIFGWGAMLVLLYVLLYSGSSKTARKAVSVVGTADFMLILGVALYVRLSGSMTIPSPGEGIVIDSPLGFFVFVLLFAGAIGKAGAWPFHTWIPDASTTASMPVMAILPASLDKLLGIYFLSRVCTDMFVLNGPAMGVMLIVGGFTVLFAVLMALVQKDSRSLLSYHAVSQVGYMVIGFGTGVPIGFAAGLFHMLNHAIYKTGLFLSAGAAGKAKGSFDIGRMGGLAKYMPATFACAVVFSLSISGVPPLNGFVSKWMVYQGVVSGFLAVESQVLKVIFIAALAAAMFGSALTLASFVKFIHAVFLGQDSAGAVKEVKEASPGMLYPLIVLAFLCVLLGVFPGLFLSSAVLPWLPDGGVFTGEWNALAAFVLMGAGILAGAGIAARDVIRRKIRVSGAYYGGQPAADEVHYPATEFYRTIQDFSLARKFYLLLDMKFMDLYNVLISGLRNLGGVMYYVVDRGISLLTAGTGAGVLGISRIIRKAHAGNLDMYFVWALMAIAALFFIIAR